VAPPPVPTEGGQPPALSAAQKRQVVLAKAFDLPAPLFRLVVSYVPWPRMWEAQLPLLHKRCTVDANEALRGALGIMDEVFTDLGVSDAPEQSAHLVRLARDPALAQRVKADPAVRMPPELLESVLRWNDAQSLLGRYEKGVTFTTLIADRVRACLRACLRACGAWLGLCFFCLRRGVAWLGSGGTSMQ